MCANLSWCRILRWAQYCVATQRSPSCSTVAHYCHPGDSLFTVTAVLAFLVNQRGGKQELFTQHLEHPGTLQELPNDRGDKCPARGMQSGNSWYLFAAAHKMWEQCKPYGSSQESRLDFIQKESYLYFEPRQDFKYYFPFWIGLSYNSSTEKWVWMDHTALSSSLLDIPKASYQHYQHGTCAYIQGGSVKVGDCREIRFCLCEKMTNLART